ncbi:hypothetical protein [Allomuricauda sp. SCSIO 65647]|uniref:DoxX family protein n=1 Tax=Allomuricauda sp. SCSIO 65647 TaxID=2908843 RepID=UPI001F17FF06|nr:hypothetical protein [Muricauda sp. SCSIO 65647]UJH68020.1 hypothetical protein L0P89_02105 [Muricauda sp. SCSIO 65647]
MNYPWHLYLMASMYIFAGTMHFVFPKAYMRIMPPYIPHHRLMVYSSGLAEVILGIGLCFALTKNISIYGIMLMLTIFFIIHFYMLTGKKAAAGIPKWILLLRVPLQFGLIYWAYWYLRF